MSEKTNFNATGSYNDGTLIDKDCLNSQNAAADTFGAKEQQTGDDAATTKSGKSSAGKIAAGAGAGFVAGAGILAGAGALGLMSFREAPETTPDPTTPHQPIAEPEHFSIDDIKIATSVTDDMTYSEAFAAARAETGPHGVFEWRGGVYGTYYASEWEGFSQDYKDAFHNANWRNEFAERGLGDRFDDHITHQPERHEMFGNHEIHTDENGREYITLTDAVTGGDVHISPDDLRYAILDENGQLIGVIGDPEELVGIVDADSTDPVSTLNDPIEASTAAAANTINIDGQEMAYVEATIDGESAIFLDTDNNGLYETAIVNNPDDPANPSIYEHDGGGVTLDEIQDLNTLEDTNQDIYQETYYPDDFVNDADVADFV